MKIPAHLSNRPTDRRGLPVPYINIWGNVDKPGSWELRHDRNVHQRAAFYVDDMTAPPDFTKQSPQRQREIVVNGMCQVCARELGNGERWLALSPISVQTIEVRGIGPHAAISEPWLCADCCTFAVDTCPALIRRAHNEELIKVQLPADLPFSVTIGKGWIEGRWELATKREPCAMFARILLSPQVVRTSAEPGPGGRSMWMQPNDTPGKPERARKRMSDAEARRLQAVINDVPERPSGLIVPPQR
jgi:hypothetical protein